MTTNDWTWLSVGIALWSGALFCLAWGILGDSIRRRFRGLRRCPRCWYDMRFSPSRICSECGWTAASEAELHRARRRWVYVAVGILLVVPAIEANRVPAIQSRGWPAAVPTTVIAVGLPWIENGIYDENSEFPFYFGDPVPSWQRALLDDLFTRAYQDEVRGWQWRIIVWRILHDDLEQLTPRRKDGFEWHAYPDLLNTMSSDDHLTVGEIRALDARSDVVIMMPEYWPEDTPIFGHAELRHWDSDSWLECFYQDPQTKAMLADHDEMTYYVPTCGNAPNPFCDAVGLVHMGAKEGETVETLVALAFSSYYRDEDETVEQRTLPTLRVRLPTTIKGRIQEYRIGEESVEIADKLRHNMQEFPPTLSVGESEGTLDLDWRALRASVQTMPLGMTLALRFEIVAEHKVVAEGSGWWCDWEEFDEDRYEQQFGFRPHCTTEIPLRVAVPSPSVFGDPGSLSLRITGDPVVSMRNFAASTYWRGSVEVKLGSIYIR